MRTKLFLLIVALSVCLTARAQTVNENDLQFILKEKTAKVILPVDSPTDQARVGIRLELLDPSGDVKASANESRSLIRGTNFVEIPIDIASALTNKDFRFYRLRYEIAGKTGILSLARATSDLFDLETFSFNFPQSRSRYMVRVRAIHPVTMKGVGNVRLEGKLSLEFNDSSGKTVDVQTRTDADGFAELTFSLPEYAKLDDLDLTIKGTKNGVVNEVEPELPEHAFTHYSYIYFQTDKPIYQPGQVLRIRSLLFSDKKKAIIDDPLTFTIKDGEGTVMSKIEAKTSRFGIASLEWQIPESVKLGKYTVTVSGERQLQNDVKTFTISRYDLPNFAVSAQATRKYYLADQQTASVKVGADYLFGKPVTSAKVRVVEETERQWNWKLQKYEMKEGQVREGVLDATGKFTAEFDLTEAHRNFRPYNGKFNDLTFAAYVTDLTTNKTEQRRFDIRITKEPIHLYLSKDDEDDQMSRDLPGRFYLTAFYADGAPAECDFNIYDQQADGNDKDDPDAGKLLARGRTNRLGAARLVMPLTSINPNHYYAGLMIKARDRGGNKGVQMEQFRFDKLKPAAQVSTDKIVYGKGESIKVDVLSSDPNATLFLSVMQNAEVLVNEKLRIRGGKAAITIPYREGMKGPLTISAYGSYRSYWGAAQSFGNTRTVLYPSPEGMTLTARASKGTYRPGEEATIELATQMTGGGAEESAFGISVIDKAIDERARTDADFGAGYSSFYQDFLGLINVAPGPDPSKPISPEEELAIEIALKRRVIPNLQGSGSYRYEHIAIFNRAFDKQFRDVSASINKRLYVELLPTDEASLRTMLADDEIDLDKMLDPWGNRFRVSVKPSGPTSVITFTSAGPDEIEDTADDITALTRHYNYFDGIGMKIRSTFGEYERRVEGIIQNYETLRDELKRQNFDLDTLRDAWGRPYRFKFGFEGTAYRLHIESGGQDRKFGGYDDFTIWTHYLDYFAVTRAKMAAGIRDYLSKNGNFPADETEFKSVLKLQGFDLDELKDVFGRRYYLASERRWRSGERRTIGSEKTKIIPISQDLVIYTLKSVGTDGLRGTPDDFELTRFVGIVPEKTTEADKEKRGKVLPSNSLLGVVTGTVADSNGAVIPGSTVTAKSVSTGREHTRTTDEEGRFFIDDLPAGTYEIVVTASHFKSLTIQGVVVDSQTLTEINGMLEVGSVSEVVTVIAGADVITSSSNLSGSNISAEFFSNLPINGRNFQGLYTIAPGVARSGLRDATGRDRDPSVAGSSGPENNYILDGVNESGQLGGVNRSGKTREQIETPRLREYFPETLLWFPELISSLDGKASFKFKLADSLTTWKVAVIGSTANGDIAIAEKEIRTFQPFFVDLDPPKFLTNGDEIFLPVQVRNYMATKQKVNVKMTQADWFSFLGADSSQVDVEPSNSNNAIFGFKAGSVVKDGKQRVTAIAQDDSDAIEKPVTVRPDGEEVVKTVSQLFSGTAVFDVDYPANALIKSQKAELKVYPNLLSHVAESVEGLLRRPYGCGEQTISSTYPNLMILKFVKEGSTLRRTAKTYLKKGYERLTGYQVESGGFSYWGGKEAADVALTAYALRFLNDAKAFIDVDPEIVRKAHDWLVKQQRSDGSWTRQYYYENAEVSARTKMFTVYVARSLAMTGDKNDPVLARAFGYLKTRGRDADEPYTLALFGLASLNAGAPETERSVAQRLEDMAIAEDGGVYWKLETDTPFYGSGTAGRLETTALVLQLLLKDAKTGVETAERKALIGKATLYLLKNKDRYGVWYSTQTTINVLDAFLAALSTEAADTADTIQISVNGKDLPPVPIAADRVEPLIIDLTDRLDPAANKVEVKGSGFASLMAQIVAIHYVDWRDSESAKGSGAVHLNYKCDKTTAAIMQDITCSVEAGKNASYGYGMLLAEIGTPPGADVSRESLQAAMDAGSSISRYDILPDRIVVYMWARPGGVKFNFKFRPRYGINAQTPASTIYDYYNPDAKATVVPMRFVVGN